jgi:hypothetical protein
MYRRMMFMGAPPQEAEKYEGDQRITNEAVTSISI